MDKVEYTQRRAAGADGEEERVSRMKTKTRIEKWQMWLSESSAVLHSSLFVIRSSKPP